jgi:glycosyltransferase involved in cell wall biosynthesis
MRYLRESVESVLNQDHSRWELLIVDDCSTDGSWEYLNSITDSRVRIFRNPANRGLFPNLNFLITQASAPLIKIWAQDDIMYSHCIREFIDFHKRHPEIGFSYSERHYINNSGELTISPKIDTTPEIVSQALHTEIAFITGSIAGNIANVALATAALEKIGPFNEGMKISGDFEMWVRIARFYPIGFIKMPLIQLRNHSEQLSEQSQYYFYHLKEDLETYKILFSYIDPKERSRGIKILRKTKFVFYFTLMLKFLYRGKFSVAGEFFNTLRRFDNIFLIALQFIRVKIFRLD